MLLDSNIIIYALQPQHDALRQFIAEHPIYVSAVSYVEVLGYHKLTDTDRHDLEEFFYSVPVLSITSPILDEAVRLRQTRKMTLGDALIAATALVHQLPLITRNTKDFDWIAGLSLSDPMSGAVQT
ncbi:MAG TPA: type II toxin-antitoxin system VapC family toxin [Blastocatellia bacterium]|nr:type II toxin-antitoxin system VapC family toxin [Blastocatellia bacterium]